MAHTLQHKRPTQRAWIQASSARSNHSVAPKADHELTFKLDQSIGAEHDHNLQNFSPVLCAPYELTTALFPDWADTWALIAKKPEGWSLKPELNDQEFAKMFGQVNKESHYL
ncbi:MAG: hypothetical protein JKY32_11720 [Rhizobiales bacterium]|nr:hypothetical protein [Hyphomicrobiales bacterium]